MPENTSINPLVADPETGKLKRCCNMDGKPLKQCGSGGGVEVGIITNIPPYGSGLGTYKKVTVMASGDFEFTGDEIPLVIPRIYHINTP